MLTAEIRQSTRGLSVGSNGPRSSKKTNVKVVLLSRHQLDYSQLRRKGISPFYHFCCIIVTED